MNLGQHILVFGIRVYRGVISPAKVFLFGPLGGCRFTPTCSAYAIQAIVHHGVFYGGWLALKRIGRCHPWGGCGDDPVPVTRYQTSAKALGDARRATAQLGAGSQCTNARGRVQAVLNPAAPGCSTAP